MNDFKSDLKTHLQSALQTFIATFLSTVGATLAAGHISWTLAFWGAIALAGVRTGVKVLFENFAPPALGGKK